MVVPAVTSASARKRARVALTARKSREPVCFATARTIGTPPFCGTGRIVEDSILTSPFIEVNEDPRRVGLARSRRARAGERLREWPVDLHYPVRSQSPHRSDEALRSGR